jgi:hypothetical protein
MLKVVSAMFLVLMLFNGFTVDESLEINIDVAPNVLNIASSGTVVTVHTNIAYSAVAGASVSLNDVEIAWWKSDSRGQFVAKFNMEEVETLVNSDILELGKITLTLSGNSNLGNFSGTQTIDVIDVNSAGKK